MAVKCGSRAITVGSLVYSTGQNSTPGLSATNSYSRALPSAVVVTILLRCVAFSVPVITPPSTRSIMPSPSSSVCTPSSLWSPSRPSTQSGTAPIPACSVAPSGIRSATSAAMARSRSPMGWAGQLGRRVVGLAEADQVAHVQLVAAEGARQPRVDLHEERHLADQRRRVLGVGRQREVAVAVRGRHGGHDQGGLHDLAHQARHLAERVGDQVAVAAVEGLPGVRRQEPRHVPQPRHLAVDVAALAHGQHLVQAHRALQPVHAGLDGVDHGVRLPVGGAHDHVAVGRDVVQDRVGGGAQGVQGRGNRVGHGEVFDARRRTPRMWARGVWGQLPRTQGEDKPGGCPRPRTKADVPTPRESGAERARTADLLVANEALFQLSYSPSGRRW